uniref:Cyclin B1 n=1 Tax=Monophyllaea glabra TaxID=1873335 RepID=A0A6F8Z4Z2_9LAMI|nr:cyclin B1 [Monophyllaea glabra]
MASKQVVQQQNRGEAAAGGGIKPKNMVAERKNRRALGDIGNLVTVRAPDAKPLPQISRPATRSFCAQLIANAQHAAAQKNKVSNPQNLVDGAQKPCQKKPEVIVISPGTEQKLGKECAEEKERSSSRKQAATLTSILTARSQAACEKVIDIDAADKNNDLAVVEYVEEMYSFYKSVENENWVHDYMDRQPEINQKMRAILIDWLIQVHHKFELSQETLYLTVNIVDRYLAARFTPRRELQLVGMSAMLIASKYEEIWAPEVNELVTISDNTYSNKQVLIMEKRILGELEWNLTVPTPYVFLVRFIKASMTDSDVENMVYFLAELGMMNYATLTFSPSKIAASAVYAARCALNKTPIWNETLRKHTGFAEAQIMECVQMLVGFQSEAAAAENKLRGSYKKYTSPERRGVALLPPPKSLLPSSSSSSLSS